jgi:hypothetical protein
MGHKAIGRHSIGSFMFKLVGEIVTNLEMALHNKTYVECKNMHTTWFWMHMKLWRTC